MKNFYIFIFLIFALLFITGCNANGDAVKNIEEGTEIVVYKSSSCGCCDLYSDYLDRNDVLTVKNVDLPDIDFIKDENNIPNNLRSCHTSIIDNYFVEGHIPLVAVDKLIKEKPDIAGIAMAGMPSGSPGMPGGKNGPFIIYAVSKDGSYKEFMRI